MERLSRQHLKIDGPEGGAWGVRCGKELTAAPMFDHKLLLGTRRHQEYHAAAESVQFPASWPFPIHAQSGLHFLALLPKVI